MRLKAIPLIGALIASLCTIPMPVAAHNRGWFPREVGECGWVHGRLAVYNGSGVIRIWVIGTSHMLNLRDDDTSGPEIIYPVTGGWRPFEDAIYGDFYACAIERHVDGEMQQVRVTRVRNYVIREPL